MNDINKSIIWIITRSLKSQLHQNARIRPAIELSKLGWHVTMVTSEVPDDLKNKSIHYLEVNSPKHFLGSFIYYFKILHLLFSNNHLGRILFFQIDSLSPILLIVPIWQAITGKKQYHVVMDYRSMPMDTDSFLGKLRSLIFYAGHSIAPKLDIYITAITNRIVSALNICNEKIIGIWPSGANIEDFKIAIETRSWANENQPIRLVYIGAIHAERNLIAVIEAATMAKKKGIDLTLDIIGAGYQKEVLQKLAENQGNGFINIWGPVPQAQIPKLLANYDIGILPFPDVPKMNVSSAIKMFEYMAAGMPVLATKIEAHVKVFNGKDFVFWTGETAESMADAIALASSSKARMSVLGENSREYSKSWSWTESAKKLSNALERIPLKEVI